MFSNLKFLKSAFFGLFLLLIFPNLQDRSTVNAVNHSLRSSYQVNYDVKNDLETYINYNISIEKVDSQDYIKSYVVRLDFADITDLVVLENGQSAEFLKTIKSDSTWIEFVLMKELIFVNDKSTLELSFKTRTFINENGLLKYAYVAPLNLEEEFISVSYILKVPFEFGEVDYISHEANPYEDAENQQTVYEFIQETTPLGFYISFGKKQQINFKLNYTLVNSSIGEKKVDITLFPESAFQQVFYTNISSDPQRVYRDLDGNYIAEFLMNPSETRTVVIEGFIQISNTPSYSEKFVLDDKELEEYLKDDEYLDLKTNKAAQVLDTVFGGQDLDKQQKILKINDFVINHLTYSTAKLADTNYERETFSNLLANGGEAICIDYADLFVGLARSADIPSRIVTGYIFDKNGLELRSNLLHAWVEYYDDGEWIGLDPTWQDTTNGYNYMDNLGINRVVLAYYGVSMRNPPVVLPFTGASLYNNEVFTLEPASELTSSENSEKQIKIDIKIGKSVFYKDLPIIVTIENQTNKIFDINQVIIDNKIARVLSEGNNANVNESVLPGTAASVVLLWNPNELVLLGGTEKTGFILKGYSGFDFFEYSDEIYINIPPSVFSCFFWIFALVISIAIIKFRIISRLLNFLITLIKKIMFVINKLLRLRKK